MISAVAAALLAPAGWTASPAQAATICTWGGTPAAPTGAFTLSPGLTNIPSPEPLRLKATGELAGGASCAGKVTFLGEANAGSTCAVTSFEGVVKGLPGVVRFWGPGVFGLVNELLYDRDGNVVGADQPQVLTEDNAPFTECNTTEGFTEGTFSSIIELF
jgi:hypothetical protein